MLYISSAQDIVKNTGNDGIVYVNDTDIYTPFHIEGGDHDVYIDQEYNTIQSIIQEHDFSVDCVYLDHYMSWPNFPYNNVCSPLFFVFDSLDFLENDTTGLVYTDDRACFFAMNMNRENRLLVSSWFAKNVNKINFDYTQGWESSDSDCIRLAEYIRLTNYSLNSFLGKKFISYKNNPSSNEPNSNQGYTNIENWNVLKDKFCSSTIAVITEPVFWQKASVITEKYLMSLYGCCFPIFCGGYGTADELTKLGFDVFDDVIDHSYQYELHPGSRVLNALENNQEVLTNHSLKKADYMPRHLANLSMVTDQLPDFIKQLNLENFTQFVHKVDSSNFDLLAKINNYLTKL